jgi:hypothetical protein
MWWPAIEVVAGFADQGDGAGGHQDEHGCAGVAASDTEVVQAVASLRWAVWRHNTAAKSSTATPDSTALTKAATLPLVSLSWCRMAA